MKTKQWKIILLVGLIIAVLLIAFGLFTGEGVIPSTKKAILGLLGRGPMSPQEVSVAFQEAVNQKDYRTLQKLLADRVYYVVEASDCCGNVSRNGAITQLEKYLKEAGPFDFSQDQQVVQKLKVNIVDQFGGYTIGIAADRKVIAYRVGSQDKVDDIYVVGTYEMFDLE